VIQLREALYFQLLLIRPKQYVWRNATLDFFLTWQFLYLSVVTDSYVALSVSHVISHKIQHNVVGSLMGSILISLLSIIIIQLQVTYNTHIVQY